MAKKKRRKKDREFEFPSEAASDLYDEWKHHACLAEEHKNKVNDLQKKYRDECGKQAGLKVGDFIAATTRFRDELPYVVLGFTGAPYGYDECMWGILCHLLKSDGTPNNSHSPMVIKGFAENEDDGSWRKINKSEVKKLLKAAT